MKIYIPFLLLIATVSSCCREYHCVHRGLDVVFVGYSKSDRDSVSLFLYEKNTSFNHIKDSMKGWGLFVDTTSTFFIQSIYYDYAIKVFNDTIRISNFEEEITTFTACHGEMVKMGECSLSYDVSGNKITKSGNTITITK